MRVTLSTRAQSAWCDGWVISQNVTNITVLNRSTPPTIHVLKSGQPAATLSTDKEGRAVLRFEAGVLSEARQAALMKMMEAFLSEV
jgi:hypothetical protein